MPLVRRTTAEQFISTADAHPARDCWVYWCVVCGPCLQQETPDGGVMTLHRGEPEDHVNLLRVTHDAPELAQ